MIVFWNGSLVEGGVVSLPVSDPLFLRGEGIFETIRADGGLPCLWERHERRLRKSALKMGLSVPEDGILQERVIEVLRANGLKSARVRITVGPEILITAEPLPERPPEVAAVTSAVPVNDLSPLAGIKATSYAENMWLVRQSGVDEVIRPNTRGELCEGCLSNVFFVKDGRIHTPSLETGCLPGVMRAEIVERVPVVEGRWPLEVLAEADEIWLSNATSRLRLVRQLDGRALPPSGGRLAEVRAAAGLAGN